MTKTKAVSEWVIANKSWIYPAASAIGGWLVRHLWPAKPCPTCTNTTPEGPQL